MNTRIRNITDSSYTLPYPYAGSLPPGGSGIASGSVADFVAAAGGAAQITYVLDVGPTESPANFPRVVASAGNDVFIYADPSGSDNNLGTAASPVKTFLKALGLVPSAWPGRVEIIPAPGTPLSDGSEAITFQHIGPGPVGLNARPLLIRGSFESMLGDLTVTGTAANTITVSIPTAVTVDQFRGKRLLDRASGGAFMIRSNTANGGSGPVTFTLNATPGYLGQYPTIGNGDLVAVQMAGTVLDFGLGNDLHLIGFEAGIGIQGVGFKASISLGSLSFENCLVYADGMEVDGSNGFALNMKNSEVIADSFQAFQAWGGPDNNNNPFFNLPQTVGLSYAASGGGSITLDQGSSLEGFLVGNGATVSQVGSRLSLVAPSVKGFSFNPKKASRIELLTLGDIRGEAVASINADSSAVEVRGVDWGGGNISAKFSNDVTIVDSDVLGSDPITEDIGILVQRMCQARIFNVTLTGTVNDVQIGNVLKSYADLAANAVPPAHAGGFTESDASGVTLNRIEVMPTALG